jgi:hypothetical protein
MARHTLDLSRWLPLPKARNVLVAALTIGLGLPSLAEAGSRDRPLDVDRLATGLAGTLGGTVGPDGMLYVPEFARGEVTRIDPESGATQLFASGFPLPAIPGVPGGVFDVAFLGGQAYALVTIVDAPEFLNDLGVPDTGANGLYRIDGPNQWTLIADLGEFARQNPPSGFDFVLPEGVQFALEAVHGGLLITDGHLNRVLFVTPAGVVRIVAQYGNVVPAGIDVVRGKVLLARTGPIAGAPGAHHEIGEIAELNARPVSSAISMAVDVQKGPGTSLYALSQGVWDPNLGPDAAGAPALPGTGALLRVDRKGSVKTLLEGLDQPTSLHFIGGTAYVVTLPGDVWRIRGVSGAGRP